MRNVEKREVENPIVANCTKGEWTIKERFKLVHKIDRRYRQEYKLRFSIQFSILRVERSKRCSYRQFMIQINGQSNRFPLKFFKSFTKTFCFVIFHLQSQLKTLRKGWTKLSRARFKITLFKFFEKWLRWQTLLSGRSA